jgi:hypothetical protein
MLSFDLKWFLFGFLLLLSLTVAAAVWLDRWLFVRGQKDRYLTSADATPLLPLFEQFPFALLVLDGPLGSVTGWGQVFSKVGCQSAC